MKNADDRTTAVVPVVDVGHARSSTPSLQPSSSAVRPEGGGDVASVTRTDPVSEPFAPPRYAAGAPAGRWFQHAAHASSQGTNDGSDVPELLIILVIGLLIFGSTSFRSWHALQAGIPEFKTDGGTAAEPRTGDHPRRTSEDWPTHRLPSRRDKPPARAVSGSFSSWALVGRPVAGLGPEKLPASQSVGRVPREFHKFQQADAVQCARLVEPPTGPIMPGGPFHRRRPMAQPWTARSRHRRRPPATAPLPALPPLRLGSPTARPS